MARQILHSSAGARLDPLIEQLIHLICREYVEPWYSKLTPDIDRQFIKQVTSILIHVIQAFEVRLAQMDMAEFCLLDLPRLLEQHITDFRCASVKMNSGYSHNMDRDTIFHQMQPHIAIKLQALDSGETQPIVDKTYLRALVKNLLTILLPPEDYRAETERAIIREIVVNIVFGNVYNKVAQPWFLHQIIGKLLQAPADKRRQARRTIPLSKSTEPILDRLIRQVGQIPAWIAIFLSFLSTLYFMVVSSPVPSSLQPYSLTAPTTDLVFAWLPQVPFLAQIHHYITNICAMFEKILSSIVLYMLREKVFTVNLAQGVLEGAEKALFPNGHPPPKVPDPTPEEQVVLQEICESNLSCLLPDQLAKYILSPTRENQLQEDLAHHLLEPFSSHVANVHFFVVVLDLICGKLFPELLAS